MAKILIAAAMLLPLSHCPGLPAPDTTLAKPTSALCALGPPPLRAGDRLSTPMARWTLTALRSGAALCGWGRPR